MVHLSDLCTMKDLTSLFVTRLFAFAIHAYQGRGNALQQGDHKCILLLFIDKIIFCRLRPTRSVQRH